MIKYFKNALNTVKEVTVDALVLDRYTLLYTVACIEIYTILFMLTTIVFGRVESPIMAFALCMYLSIVLASMHRKENELIQFQDYLVKRIQNAKVISLSELENM